MSGQVSRETEPLLPPSQDHRELSRCCKLSYKPRKFSSKGAVLVLVWQLLSVAALYQDFAPQSVYSILSSKLQICLFVVAVVALQVVCIAVGWLADVHLGRMKVVKVGMFLMWFGELIMNVCKAVLLAVPDKSGSTAFTIIYFAGSVCTFIGAASFFINIVQFGLEQIPDSSSVGITAFISWFTIATLFGIWIHQLYQDLLFYCASIHFHSQIQLCIGFTLLSIAVCSMFLFSHWLIDHRQNRNPLKTVYRVLKFAKQHKFPIQRSAFTYWEEEIPSRIDLGKSKYGGPFTTEEVEDVKTFFRIIAVMAAVLNISVVVAELVFFYPVAVEVPVVCIEKIISNTCLVIPVVLCLLYELLLYPVMRCHMPMLRRIGCCASFIVVLSLLFLALTLLSTLGSVDITGHFGAEYWISVGYGVVAFSIGYVLLTSIVEFSYSQSPEHVKGFLIGTFTFTEIVTIAVISLIPNNVIKSRIRSSQEYFATYLAAASAVHSLLAFIIYCCVARWYKRRERDEPCNQRAIIEEIYGRHVEHNSIEETDTT